MKKGLQWLVVGEGNGFPCWKRNLVLAVTTLMYFRQASGSKNIFACVENGEYFTIIAVNQNCVTGFI